MQHVPIVVIAVDGLRASALGAYGNTAYMTPALDRLASESLLYDNFLVDSDDLRLVYRSLWSGQHALVADASPPPPTLAELLKRAGYACHLVTDEPLLAEHPAVASLDEITLLQADATAAATSVAETAVGQVLAAAIDVAAELALGDKTPFLWIHVRGWRNAWDAPPELGESLVDDEDPPLPLSIEIPTGAIAPGDPDDQAFFATCRYGGQAIALDACFEEFNAALGVVWPAYEPALVLLGARGFALGEHGVIGEEVPYEEQFHTPLSVRLPDRSQSLRRNHTLWQPHHLFQLISQLAIGGEPAGEDLHRIAVSHASGRLAIRTTDWIAVDPPAADSQPPLELYVKPDDLWEANDIASLCEDELEQFTQLRAALLEQAAAGKRFEAPEDRDWSILGESQDS